MPNKTENEASKNDSPLTREILPIANWHEWLKLWHEAKNLQVMEGLLHVGFSMVMGRMAHDESEYGYEDRIMFYFFNADGWFDNNLLKSSGQSDYEYLVGHDINGNSISKNQSELRQQVAVKAFEVLCQNFFKIKIDPRYTDDLGRFWGELVFSEKLFPLIQKFFRVEKERYGDHIIIRNLRPRPPREGWSHSEQLVVDFFVGIAGFIFKWREPGIDSWVKEPERSEKKKIIAEKCARMAEAKLWMIEILNRIRRLDVLRERMLELDKPCLAKLKEIAMRAKLNDTYHPIEKDRLVTSLEEACYAGSKVALFLLEHKVATDVQRRLLQLRKARMEKDEAEERLKKLSGKKP